MSKENVPKQIWPLPAGTTISEIRPTDKDIEKYRNILLNALPETTRKVIEKIFKEEKYI